MAAVAALRRAMLAVSARDWLKGMKPCVDRRHGAWRVVSAGCGSSRGY